MPAGALYDFESEIGKNSYYKEYKYPGILYPKQGYYLMLFP